MEMPSMQGLYPGDGLAGAVIGDFLRNGGYDLEKTHAAFHEPPTRTSGAMGSNSLAGWKGQGWPRVYPPSSRDISI